tara:strand:- start:10140 stop:10913 length:774 start_codon:yes stop_codon:yes gene_type:complete
MNNNGMIYEPNYLLTIGSDAKTVKGEKHNYLTGIQYALPSREVYEHRAFAKLLRAAGIDDYNACLWAGNCKAICLNTAGRGAFSTTQVARGKRTVFKLLEPDQFRMKLIMETQALIGKADRKGMTPCVRPNGTTDEDYGWLFPLFPDLQFYDYTKSLKRLMSCRHDNYHLTFSYDGTAGNWSACKRALQHGHNVAIAFSGEPETWPKEIYRHEVINGDDSDLRFKDPKGKVVGLQAKGKARKDTSGFVWNTNKNLPA